MNTDFPAPNLQASHLSLTDAPKLTADPNTLILNDLLTNDTPWQIHNCKIIDKSISQDEKLPFLYHYDALSDDIKSAHPLNAELLKQFQTPMFAADAAKLIGISEDLVKTPWQVKVTGTLVMFCDRLQIALRLKFTNTAKDRDPIYTQNKAEALQASMQDWHFYGDVFVLNKSTQPLVVTAEDEWMALERLEGYQALPAQYALTILALLEDQKPQLTQLQEAIELRLV